MKYKKLKVQDSATACDAVKFLLKETQECFVVIGVATSGQLAGIAHVARGSMTECHVSVADVFRAALVMAVPRIVLAHNHPSGNVTPSAQDIAMTKRIYEAGQLLDITVLDHIIVGNNRVPGAWKKPVFASMRDMGLIGSGPCLSELRATIDKAAE